MTKLFSQLAGVTTAMRTQLQHAVKIHLANAPLQC